jgi:circadian clock protein KaiC
LTSLTHDGQGESSAMTVSSLVDTWLVLRNTEHDGERNRLLFVIKSRGSAHSNQVREFVLTDHGSELLDVYVGPQGVLTGAARVARQAAERASADVKRGAVRRRQEELARRAKQVEQQIAELTSELAREQAELEQTVEQELTGAAGRDADRVIMAARRWADPAAPAKDQAASHECRRRSTGRGFRSAALRRWAEPEIDSRHREPPAGL